MMPTNMGPPASRTSSSSSSSASLRVASSPSSPSQTSTPIRQANAEAENSLSLATPFSTSPTSSANSPSPLVEFSHSARTVRFARHGSTWLSSRGYREEKQPSSLCVQLNPSIMTPSPSTLTSSVDSPIPSSPCVEPWGLTRHSTSPTSSAFVSATASPFIPSPAVTSIRGFASWGNACVSLTETITLQPNPSPALEYTPSFNRSKRLSASNTPHYSSLNAIKSKYTNASRPGSRVLYANSDSPSSSARFRTCDVYIGTHSKGAMLARFARWLCAELELQGIACFVADRAKYFNGHSHVIALRTISTCTFGLVIITKETFQNFYSLQEIYSFLQRKNLVPLYFDISPADCLGRDIVERRGCVWEKDGGELWRIYDGDEREWMETLDGLSKLDEWKLEAHSCRWRDCILKAVSLLGMRLGRRSIVECERERKEKADQEEFPFPRNTSFVGREKELRALESLLFGTDQDDDVLPGRLPLEESNWFRSDRRWREKSDSDQWYLHLGGDEICSISSGNSSTSCSFRFAADDDVSKITNLHAKEVCKTGRPFETFRDEIPSYRHHQRQTHLRKQIVERDSEASFAKPVCLTGAAGIGKTEIVLEYAYRHSQRYRMVLWVGGESRYVRQNYLKLSVFLGLDVGAESQAGPESGTVRTFDEQEMEAFERVKRELQRDVPYLLIIDNVESEYDWWDGRALSELIPRGGATHVILTTRLSKVLNLQVEEVPNLSSSEALRLMQGKRQFSLQEVDALKEIETKLERSSFGLAMVGSLLLQLPIMPHQLLQKMEKFAVCQQQCGTREAAALKINHYLAKLIGVCFSFLDQRGSRESLALNIAIVGGWFGPFSLPLPLLAFAARRYSEKSQSSKFFSIAWALSCASSQIKKQVAEASSILANYGIARKCSLEGWIKFPELVQVYARNIGGLQAAKFMVQSVRKRGSVVLHPELLWAACFLVLGFANDAVVVELKVLDLLLFVRKVVLPLALGSVALFSQCYAALELLRLSTNALENVESLCCSKPQQRWIKSFCFKKRTAAVRGHVDEHVCQDVTLLKALIFEIRAKLMLKGGQFECGEDLCRTCISIRTVMLGHDHPDTISAQETLAKLVHSRSNMSSY